MKNSTHIFSNPEFGTALYIHCIESKTRLGIGKKSKNGSVDFYIPFGLSEETRKHRIIEEFIKLTKLDESKIELINGAKQSYIITFIGLSTGALNKFVE